MTKSPLSKADLTSKLPHCYLCSSPTSILYSHLTDRLANAEGSWSFIECTSKSCGLISSFPLPQEDEINSLYEGYSVNQSGRMYGKGTRWSRFLNGIADTVETRCYGCSHGAVSGLADKTGRKVGRLVTPFPYLYRLFGERIMWVNRRKGDTRILDIGCGSGTLLNRLRSLGWTTLGVEPDPVAAEKGRQLGLEIETGTIETIDWGNRTFDAITLQHVVEHMLDPVSTMSQIRKLLNPNGLVYIAIPNPNSLGAKWLGPDWLGWDVPRHLHMFPGAALSKLLDQSGMQILSIRTSGRVATWLWKISQTSKTSNRTERKSLTSIEKTCGKLAWITEEITSPFTMWGEEIIAVAGPKT